MEGFVIPEIETLKLFVLVMVRFGGLVVAAPVLGSSNFPLIAKIGLVALTAMLITPTLSALDTPLPEESIPFAALAVGEVAIGLIMGFVMTLVFAAIQVGGQVMDMQTGFGMMNVFNPALETQFPIFGFFFFIIAVLYLLMTYGHHLMIRAMVSTYQQIPIGGFVARRALMLEITRWGRVMFIDGLMIAAPVAGSMLLAYITMGLLGRVVPQIHLFVVGFPLTIATGLLVVALIINVYLSVLDGMFYRMFEDVETVIRGVG
ncbi:MAG TPA: flagellar biosynthetic protein FliR [Candidatus Hydrogenedentes bacterium]|nr:flagellar biosynthetic protein FliR [Candidatus Hydrogenedentota bacterium]HPG69366.1 flagellar biosynthetic protein FliR [Candidatus Hydrogenedentota bacterium]